MGAIIANCRANIERIVTASRRLGAVVILTTIFPLGNILIERRLFWSDDVADSIAQVNGFIHSLESEGVVILNTEAILADERGIVRGEYSHDFLHLSAAGYEALNKALIPILMARWARSTPPAP